MFAEAVSKRCSEKHDSIHSNRGIPCVSIAFQRSLDNQIPLALGHISFD